MANAKSDALVGISKLEEVAALYEQTALTLRGIAKGLREALAGVEAPGGHPEASDSRKGPSKPSKVAPRKRRKLSAAAKAEISRKMKAKWQERKAKAATPAPKRRASDPANGKQAPAGEAA